MEFWKKLKLFGGLKIVGIVFGGLIVLAVIITVVGMVSSFRPRGAMVGSDFNSPGMYKMADVAGEASSYGNSIAPSSLSLSLRNIVGKEAPPAYNQTAGNDAEDYEVTNYSASIRTRDLNNVCAQIAGLKSLDYVIFESANLYNQGCNYVFKVKIDRKEEILAVIKSLKPRDLTESSYTIKRQVDDFTSEIDILTKKRASIDETLGKAILSYDEVTNLAVQTKDVESLTKIIDNKLQLINRLATERISVNSELERLNRQKTDQLDRLAYNYFQITVVESKFIDGQAIKDSWRNAVKDFINNINKMAQNVTINLLSVVVVFVQIVFYFFILLLAVKYGWKLTKYLWKR